MRTIREVDATLSDSEWKEQTFQKAREAFYANDYSEALYYLDRILNRFPKHVNSLTLRGHVSNLTSKYRTAFDDLCQAINLAYTNYAALTYRALYLFNIDSESARQTFEHDVARAIECCNLVVSGLNISPVAKLEAYYYRILCYLMTDRNYDASVDMLAANRLGVNFPPLKALEKLLEIKVATESEEYDDVKRAVDLIIDFLYQHSGNRLILMLGFQKFIYQKLSTWNFMWLPREQILFFNFSFRVSVNYNPELDTNFIRLLRDSFALEKRLIKMKKKFSATVHKDMLKLKHFHLFNTTLHEAKTDELLNPIFGRAVQLNLISFSAPKYKLWDEILEQLINIMLTDQAPNLLHLDLSFNRANTRAYSAVAARLKTNKRIRTLKLHGNYYDPDYNTAIRLADVARAHPRLRLLTVNKIAPRKEVQADSSMMFRLAGVSTPLEAESFVAVEGEAEPQASEDVLPLQETQEHFLHRDQLPLFDVTLKTEGKVQYCEFTREAEFEEVNEVATPFTDQRIEALFQHAGAPFDMAVGEELHRQIYYYKHPAQVAEEGGIPNAGFIQNLIECVAHIEQNPIFPIWILLHMNTRDHIASPYVGIYMKGHRVLASAPDRSSPQPPHGKGEADEVKDDAHDHQSVATKLQFEIVYFDPLGALTLHDQRADTVHYCIDHIYPELLQDERFHKQTRTVLSDVYSAIQQIPGFDLLRLIVSGAMQIAPHIPNKKKLCPHYAVQNFIDLHSATDLTECTFQYYESSFLIAHHEEILSGGKVQVHKYAPQESYSTPTPKCAGKCESFTIALPDQEVFEVRVGEVDGDGDCGFTSLGTTRQRVFDCLMRIIDSPEAIDFLAAEIKTYLYAENRRVLKLPGDYPGRWQELKEAEQKASGSYNTAIADLARKLGAEFDFDYILAQNLDDPEFLAHVEAKDAQAELTHLRECYDVMQQADEQLTAYCKDPVIYAHYVQQYLGNEWLGIWSALLYAQHNNITLYVWQKPQRGGDRLELKISHDAGPLASNTVHVLYVNGNHFNFLWQAPDEPLDEEIRTTVGATVAQVVTSHQREPLLARMLRPLLWDLKKHLAAIRRFSTHAEVEETLKYTWFYKNAYHKYYFCIELQGVVDQVESMIIDALRDAEAKTATGVLRPDTLNDIREMVMAISNIIAAVASLSKRYEHALKYQPIQLMLQSLQKHSYQVKRVLRLNPGFKDLLVSNFNMPAEQFISNFKQVLTGFFIGASAVQSGFVKQESTTWLDVGVDLISFLPGLAGAACSIFTLSNVMSHGAKKQSEVILEIVEAVFTVTEKLGESEKGEEVIDRKAPKFFDAYKISHRLGDFFRSFRGMMDFDEKISCLSRFLGLVYERLITELSHAQAQGSDQVKVLAESTAAFIIHLLCNHSLPAHITPNEFVQRVWHMLMFKAHEKLSAVMTHEEINAKLLDFHPAPLTTSIFYQKPALRCVDKTNIPYYFDVDLTRMNPDLLYKEAHQAVADVYEVNTSLHFTRQFAMHRLATHAEVVELQKALRDPDESKIRIRRIYRYDGEWNGVDPAELNLPLYSLVPEMHSLRDTVASNTRRIQELEMRQQDLERNQMVMQRIMVIQECRNRVVDAVLFGDMPKEVGKQHILKLRAELAQLVCGLPQTQIFREAQEKIRKLNAELHQEIKEEDTSEHFDGPLALQANELHPDEEQLQQIQKDKCSLQ